VWHARLKSTARRWHPVRLAWCRKPSWHRATRGTPAVTLPVWRTGLYTLWFPFRFSAYHPHEDARDAERGPGQYDPKIKQDSKPIGITCVCAWRIFPAAGVNLGSLSCTVFENLLGRMQRWRLPRRGSKTLATGGFMANLRDRLWGKSIRPSLFCAICCHRNLAESLRSVDYGFERFGTIAMSVSTTERAYSNILRGTGRD
jgi:hypothetical protein